MRIVYGVLAAFLIWVSVSVIVSQVNQVLAGERLPSDPNKRTGFIVGLFIVPTAVLAGGIGCGYLAFRTKVSKAELRQKPDHGA